MFDRVSLDKLVDIAHKIIQAFPQSRVFAFWGEMGAGKTTLIKQLCSVLNVTHTVNSPTFAIINEYLTQDNQKVFHCDFYRIKNLNEAMDLGLDDYFDSHCYCFLEWSENITSLLPDHFVRVEITTNADLTRTIQVHKKV